ncbi:MAG: hypothetical protein EB117_09125 [Betaproteobacteria bacterium]|nr:hypothetical protein [Betaproteobacteria bacterium]
MTTDDELLRLIEQAEATKAMCDKNIKQHKAELLNRREKEIQQLLKAKDEPFGDVKIVVGNREIKVNVPKKVSWEQKKLAEKRKLIIEAGDNPDVYIDTEYSVSETAYKKWPDDVREFFQDARTVSAGNPSIKIVEDKE